MSRICFFCAAVNHKYNILATKYLISKLHKGYSNIIRIIEMAREWNIVNALKEFITMPYYKNATAATKHEEEISKVLCKHGFIKWIAGKKLNRKETMKWVTQPELCKEMPAGSYIEQPFGTQNSPDYIVKIHEGFILPIEAKSSETSYSPTYNSGGVKQEYLYVFCSKKTDATTIFMGNSIITETQQRLIDEHIQRQRIADEELNKMLSEKDTLNRGIAYYTRPMIIQQGGKLKTDYFSHLARKNTEESTIQYVSECVMRGH